MNKNRFLAFICLLIATAMTAGCGDSSSDSATMGLSVADTPVDGATKVTVVFTGVQLHGDSGATTQIDFATPKQIDLMAAQNGSAAVLFSGQTVTAGKYQWIRLLVDTGQSTITLSDGSVHSLTIPSGSRTGLKLVSGFTVAAGSQANFTIDFDLRQAVTLANGGTGQYILKPALRLVDNQQVGRISGTVSNTFTIGTTLVSDTSCGPAVYIYSGANVTPVDINTTSSVQPVTTATLSLNTATGDYDYTAAFIEPGDYTLAVTCAADDDPDVADVLTFSATRNTTVTAGTTSTVNFP